jgi:CRP-like cAMP-binding protein
VIDEAFAREVLARCVLFSRLDPASLDACAQRLRRRRYRRDETVFHQGDPGDALQVIASGSVKVLLPSPETGDSAILATLGPGEFFGELALLDGEPHSASVVALEPAETLVLHRDDLLELVDSSPDLRRALLASLAGELRRLTEHAAALHFLGLPGRLAQRIGDLAARDEADANGELRLDWPYTQAELAAMIGGTRESVNRLLADFVGRGLLRFDRDTLIVTDLDRLLAEARR